MDLMRPSVEFGPRVPSRQVELHYLAADLRGGTGGAGSFRRVNRNLTRIVANEPVTEPVAVGLDPSGGRVRKMDRQHQRIDPGDLAEESPARVRRLHSVPIED